MFRLTDRMLALADPHTATRAKRQRKKLSLSTNEQHVTFRRNESNSEESDSQECSDKPKFCQRREPSQEREASIG